MVAVGESSLGRRYTDITLIWSCWAISRGRWASFGGRDLTGCQQSSDGNIFSQHVSFSSFFTWAWDLQNHAHTHAFTGAQREAQSTVVLRYHSLCTIIAQHFLAIRVHITSLRPAYIILLLSINFSLRSSYILLPSILFAILVLCPAEIFLAIRVICPV